MFQIIKEEAFRKELDAVIGRAFLFYGSEDYLKNAAVRTVRERLCPDPAMAFFNDIILDAADFTADKLLDTMTAPPMMTDARLIVLRGFDFTKMSAADLEALTDVLVQLSEYDYNCILIPVDTGMIDEGYSFEKPSTLLKKLTAVLTPVYFEAPTDARLAKWVAKHFAHYGVTASAADCTRLINHTGKTMYVLANEVEKLAYYVLSKGRDTLAAQDIPLVAAISPETDTFALSNALLAGNSKGALAALGVMKFERIPPPVILGEIASILSYMQGIKYLLDAGKSIKEAAAALRLHDYKAGLYARAASRSSPERLVRAIALAAEADAELKRSSQSYSPIEKLICSL